ncbi:trehalose-phosphatase [Devosia pacifica]|nr:trehalose-phosphatase [Devosia pacifica]
MAPGVKLAIFTDFDGTLVDIAERPEEVEVPVALAHQLERAARELDSALAVITGRQIEDIDHFLAPLTLPVAGAHGSQRRRVDGSIEGLDADTLTAAEEIAGQLESLIVDNPELIIERKKGAVALHYRQAPDLEYACRIAMEEATYNDDRFDLIHGKMVIEARPHGMSKGTALKAFMQEAPFRDRTPIFIGDDVTDEDGFIAAQELGGIGIKLGTGKTAAKMRIADVDSVHSLIQGLGDMAANSREHELQTA